jgi:hypothetical protein
VFHSKKPGEIGDLAGKGRAWQKSEASGGYPLPDWAAISECWLVVTPHSRPHRRNGTNSDCPSDEQMQFISNESNTFGFSLPGSISCFSLSIFQEMISILERNAITITDTNFTELDRLCKRFDFSQLAAKFSEFRSSMDFKEGKAKFADARGRIRALEKRQINTTTTLRGCRTKSLSSAQILGVL